MRPYIVAAFLFAVSLVGLGFLAAIVISPPQPATSPQVRSAPASGTHGVAVGPDGMKQRASGQSGPATPPQNYASGMPNGGRPAAGMVGTPGTSGTPGGNTAPAPVGQAGFPNLSGMPPAVPHPPDGQRVSVPVIQPTDLGSATSQTAGRYHQ